MNWHTKSKLVSVGLRLLILLSIILIWTPVYSQSPDTTSHSENINVSNEHFISPPVVTSGLSPIIPETTHVLTEDTTKHLSAISEDGSKFIFTEGTPKLDAIKSGEVIVSGVSQVAPTGFLRKVTGVTSANDQIVIITQPATLEEAIQQGSVQISRRLSPKDIEASMNRAGVVLETRSTSRLEDNFFIEVNDVVLYDGDDDLATTYDQIKANGSIELAPDFYFNLVICDWQLQELTFINNTTEIAELEFVTGVEIPLIEREHELARYPFAPITIFVGFVPIVLKPVLTVNIGIDGSVHVGVTTSVTQEITLTAGLRYEDSTWNPVNDFSNEFRYNPPTLSAGLDVKGYAGSQISLLLYGVTGPYVEVNAFLKLEADIFATPWWKLYGGLEVPAGVKTEIFGRTIADYETVVIGYQILLAQADIVDEDDFNRIIRR